MKRTASALLENDSDGTSAAILLACMSAAAASATSAQNTTDEDNNVNNDDDEIVDHEEEEEDSSIEITTSSSDQGGQSSQLPQQQQQQQEEQEDEEDGDRKPTVSTTAGGALTDQRTRMHFAGGDSASSTGGVGGDEDGSSSSSSSSGRSGTGSSRSGSSSSSSSSRSSISDDASSVGSEEERDEEMRSTSPLAVPQSPSRRRRRPPPPAVATKEGASSPSSKMFHSHQRPQIKTAPTSRASKKQMTENMFMAQSVSSLSVPYNDTIYSHGSNSPPTVVASPSTSLSNALACFGLSTGLDDRRAHVNAGGGGHHDTAVFNHTLPQQRQQLPFRLSDERPPQRQEEQPRPTIKAQDSPSTTAQRPTSKFATKPAVNASSSSLSSSSSSSQEVDPQRTLELEQETERLVQREFSKLSMEERGKVYDELYGRTGQVSQVAEDPTVIKSLLKQMDCAIYELLLQPRTDTTAYEHALSLSPHKVQDASFKLMFLRAEEYDPRQAGRRIIRYFAGKEEIWGRNKLVDDITYIDLDDDDREALFSGLFQVHPDQRDKSGRLVSLLYEPQQQQQLQRGASRSWKCRIRVFWYLWSKVLQSTPDRQRQGVVAVIYNVDAAKPDSSFMKSITKSHLFLCLPIRVVGYHFCFKNPLLRHGIALLKVGLSPNLRLRFKSHFGTDLEVQYSLGKFGISENCLPVDLNGRLETKRHMEYVTELIRSEYAEMTQHSTDNNGGDSVAANSDSTKEVVSSKRGDGNSDAKKPNISQGDNPGNTIATSKNSSDLKQSPSPKDEQTKQSAGTTGNESQSNGLIKTPSPNDVLLGRGRYCQSHHGTIEFNKLVEKYRLQYQIAQTHIEKTTINQLIVQIIHEKNGRFLQRDKGSGLWREVPKEIAWERVGRRYRK